jgi:hypothetical protein
MVTVKAEGMETRTVVVMGKGMARVRAMEMGKVMVKEMESVMVMVTAVGMATQLLLQL